MSPESATRAAFRQFAAQARISLGKAVATAMVHDPAAGLAAADELADVLARHHRFHAVRGHLLEMSGDTAAAAAAYETAAR